MVLLTVYQLLNPKDSLIVKSRYRFFSRFLFLTKQFRIWQLTLLYKSLWPAIAVWPFINTLWFKNSITSSCKHFKNISKQISNNFKTCWTLFWQVFLLSGTPITWQGYCNALANKVSITASSNSKLKRKIKKMIQNTAV